MSTTEAKVSEIEAALKAAREARNLTHKAFEGSDLTAGRDLDKAKGLLLEAEGLIVQARYWQSTESD